MRSRRLPVREEHRKDRYFIVPAGTYLVIHFINRIKERYRFIDLLKPETNTVLPLLLALEPKYRPLLADIVRVGPIALDRVMAKLHPHLQESTLPRHAGNLGGLEPSSVAATESLAEQSSARTANFTAFETFETFTADPNVSLDRVLSETLGPDTPLFVPSRQGEDLSVRDWLKSAHDWLSTKLNQLQELAESASCLYRLHNARTDERRRQELHAALRHLNCNDASFELGVEQPQYRNAAEDTASLGKFEVVTYGHTHLPKKVPLGEMKHGRSWYFNTGCWCDVMRLPSAVARPYADSHDALEEFVGAIRDNEFGRYIRRYLTFLEVDLIQSEDSYRVGKAELYSYCGPGRERSAPLTSFPSRGHGVPS
jgi:hypothetical protein